MNKKVIAILSVVGLLVIACVVGVSSMMHGKSEVDPEVGTEDLLVVPTEGGNDDAQTVHENQDAIVVDGVMYMANLNDYISTDEFAQAVSQYGDVTVVAYSGGVGGEFGVELETSSGSIRGTWYDMKGEWVEE